MPAFGHCAGAVSYTHLFGFTSAAWLEKLGVWLTPVLLLSEACHVQYDTITDAAGNSMLGDPYFAGLGYASLYALIGLVLAGLALARCV